MRRADDCAPLFPRTVAVRVWFLPALLLLLTGCGREPDNTKAATPATTVSAAVAPRHDPARVRRGAEIYGQNCARCHGVNAEGAPNWQRPGPDGKYPAPPLNGTGHAWHHPAPALKTAIRRGTVTLGGSMPAWEGKLGDEDIEAVIAWFQSFWPEEIYQSWLAMDRKARQGGGIR